MKGRIIGENMIIDFIRSFRSFLKKNLKIEKDGDDILQLLTISLRENYNNTEWTSYTMSINFRFMSEV